jgi:hypothetical protein
MTAPSTMSSTRRALHAVAELLIAGPQYAATGDIRLAARPGGFGGVTAGSAAVSGTDLVTEAGRFPLQGRLIELAEQAGITPRALRDVYQGGPEFTLDELLDLTPADAGVLLRAFTDGDAALRRLAPDQEPVLWPEHFDIGISQAEINFGVSPGDSSIEVPYAYVGPWTVPSGPFWNQPFGAARPMSELPTPQDIVRFFDEGTRAARASRG